MKTGVSSSGPELPNSIACRRLRAPASRSQFAGARSAPASGSNQQHFDSPSSEFFDSLGGRGRVGDQYIKLLDLRDQ